ncbi:uncharacterized protein AB675_7181 [Cyphellophora attinorum]|uniref:Uncharacterized protein n=1 Tax=Cyphellophora attinorum TaxID=1664694 RepID=A0A0N1HEZ0_9EURO|nr:uncharacterized protein AB675_7181 [Phialophora attinorum]KPI43575.1 hypothetical protein AB675_7181 [Phialophora attinorum]
MSEFFKASIKHNASIRRDRRLHKLDDDIGVSIMDLANLPNETSIFTEVAAEERPASSCTIRPNSTAALNGSWALSPLAPPSFSSAASRPAVPIQLHLSSAMLYLDHVFPFLFPFYQPPLIETGRQWLLGLLCQNDVSFHLASSLSAYFFSLVQNDGHTHDDCRDIVWNKLIEQMDLALSSIQNSISETRGTLLDKIRVMQDIGQFLVVEVIVRTEADWMIHLTPAMCLFDEIFARHEPKGSPSSITALLQALPSGIPPHIVHHKSLPNTADQSALIFFASLLLFVDIIASTALGSTPSLRKHHSLLSDLRLENVVGCQTWVLEAIASTSALCAWKQDAKERDKLSFFQLIRLANPISTSLEKGLAELDSLPSLTKPRLSAYYALGHVDRERVIATKIWANAALIYLSVSVFGWQVNNVDVQSSISRVLSLVENIDSPAQLRSLSWPLCIVGSMASTEQEQSFRRIATGRGALDRFGTLSTALCIMEAIWNSIDVDRSDWEISTALNVLGSPALLF